MKKEAETTPSETKRQRKARIFRINFFFFIVFLLFAALVVRLGIVQIVQGEEYAKEVSRTEVNVAQYPAPRGKMFDRNGRIVVDNKNVPAVTYTVEKTTKTKDKLETAKKLAQLIDLDTSFLRERDLRDYWIAKNPKKAENLLTEKEKKLEPKETYPLQVERVPEEEIKKIEKDPKELELAALYTKFSSGYAYEPQIVATNLSQEEVSKVAEQLENLPGVDVITDWERVYPYDDVFKTILGKISSPKEGIPEDNKSFFVARGYARNERVGKSYLEQQYEDYLNPRKAKVQYISDKDGNTISQKEIDDGRRGFDLKLSIDIELQKRIEKIVDQQIKAARGRGNYLVDRAFVVMMDPYKGDVLAMVGRMYDSGEMLNFDYGAFGTQYEMGSTVKGATVLAGYQFGLRHGTVFYDAPIRLKGTPEKSSYQNMGAVSDLTALQRSSNVYMFHIAMKIAGIQYYPGRSFPAKDEDFQKMRNYYAQFGLGVPTGIDLPQESAGQQSDPGIDRGKLLDLAIGQFDTYTPLQMAQYVSTIANGGYRVKPRLVTEILEPTDDGLGPIAQEMPVKVLNRINNTEEDIQRVQQGFYLVTNTRRGTAYAQLHGLNVAGKTGTAETTYYGTKRQYWGTDVYNLTFIGYYPAKDPQVAFSVVVPWTKRTGSEDVNKRIARDIVKAYIDLQKEYAGNSNAKSNDDEQ